MHIEHILDKKYSPAQREHFASICGKVHNGDLTMNQAFKQAQDSFSNAEGDSEGGFGGGFNDWLSTAQDAGWIDAGIGLVGNLLNRNEGTPPPPPPPPPPPAPNYVGMVLLGVGVIVAVGGLYWLAKKK